MAWMHMLSQRAVAKIACTTASADCEIRVGWVLFPGLHRVILAMASGVLKENESFVQCARSYSRTRWTWRTTTAADTCKLRHNAHALQCTVCILADRTSSSLTWKWGC